MPDNQPPQTVHVPLLIGEAFGRVEIPLAGLPDGVAAFTIPKKDLDGDVRVPVDRKGRIHPKEADLIATQPMEAFAPPTGLSTAHLRWILETGSIRRWPTVKGNLGERAWPISVDLVRAGGVVIRCAISDVRTWEPRSLRLTHAWAAQAEDLLREIRGLPVPRVARADLMAVMAEIPELGDEATLLAAVSGDVPLHVPPRSRTGAGAWTAYEAGIRAACYWYQRQASGDRRLTEREVAAQALGGSKKWTTAGKAAFANVLGRPLDVLLDKAESEIRVRGPLCWTVGSVAVNAAIAHPWIGLPSQGIRLVGRIEHQARGVLVVENSDTFQQACTLPGITDWWLCVWGKGSVTDGVVAFLKTLTSVPIAAWCDLDAYGVRIVSDLARRVGREITPVGMSVDLYTNGTKYRPDDLPESKRVAEQMAIDGIESLRDLARSIAASGGLGCEQETLYDQVLPALAKELFKLVPVASVEPGN
jgi:hypothetical protein